jgi:meiotic recombination protein DMC1
MGINAVDIQKLKSAGFCTVLSIIQATKKELLNIKGITDGKLEKI